MLDTVRAAVSAEEALPTATLLRFAGDSSRMAAASEARFCRSAAVTAPVPLVFDVLADELGGAVVLLLPLPPTNARASASVGNFLCLDP
ncbi:MAG: hypothetical protein LBE44_00465 [Microbacterium hominis]|nr:hypothetical protein [Microbacterium hominis]